MSGGSAQFREGLYKATYSGVGGTGYGLVYMAGGKVYGGDSMIYYVGTYSTSPDGAATARLKAQPYIDQAMSQVMQLESLFGLDKNIIELHGKLRADGNVRLEARSKNASGIKLEVLLTFLHQ